MFCSKCNKSIDEKVYDYSRKRWGNALCREHQPQPVKESSSIKHQPTQEARKLGNLLIDMGHKVEFEKYDGYKHIDIAIVNKKVNIEVDGSQHHSKQQALRDLKRTFYSWNKDYVTLRIPNSLTQDNTIEETAKYIDMFLSKDRTKLEKEIKEEYIEEKNPFWNDATNFINGVNNLVNNVSNAVSDVGNAFGNLKKSFNFNKTK